MSKRNNEIATALDPVVEHYFPDEWKQVNASPHATKGRKRLRRKLITALRIQVIKEKTPDAACRNCIHSNRGADFKIFGNLECHLDSPQLGSVKPDYLCPKWEDIR